MTSLKKLDHRQSTMTLGERSKMLAAKPEFGIGQNRVGEENSTCSRGVEPQFLVLLLVLSSCGGVFEKYGEAKRLPANANVGRSALADVSNVKSNSSRIFGGDACKRKSGKSERIKSLQRVSVGTGVKTEFIIKDIFPGKRRESPSQAISKLQTSKRAIKDLQAPSENQRTKAMGLNGESIVTDGRRTSNTSLKLIRKSLPVLKVNREEASIPKENAGRNSEGKRGYYVMAKVGKKVVPRVIDTTRSHVLRNRVSDGFVIMSNAAVNKVSALENTAALKAGLKSMEKQKGILGSSACKVEPDCTCYAKLCYTS